MVAAINDSPRFLRITRSDDNRRTSYSRGIPGSPELFYTVTKEKNITSKHLPYPRNIDHAGFIDYIARTQLFGIYDANFSETTLTPGWRRVPDCSEVFIDSGTRTISTQSIESPWKDYKETCRTLNESIWECREKLVDSATRILGSAKTAYCEFSGGIDSGIVLSIIKRRIADANLTPLTVHYPFYEFYNENYYRDKLASWLNVFPNKLCFEDCLPYSSLESVPRHETPSLASTSYGFFAASRRQFISEIHSSSYFTGHGGDRLFTIDPTIELTGDLEERPTWLNKVNFTKCQDRFQTILADFNSRTIAFGAPAWDFSMIEPPWCFANNNMKGTSTPFLDRDFMFALRDVTRFLPRNFDRSRKNLARIIFDDLLPDFIWTRQGKVDHLGCAYRGAAMNRHTIMSIASDIQRIGSDLGVDAKKYLAETLAITDGALSASKMWGAVLSILIWLKSMRMNPSNDS